MRLTSMTARTGVRTMKLSFAIAIMALLFSSSFAAAYAFNFGQNEELSAITGEWYLVVTQDGKPSDTEIKKHTITLVIKQEDGKLAGKAHIPLGHKDKTEADGNYKPVEWNLIQPSFDGKSFTFQVDNGEEILDGKLNITQDGLEGRWISLKSRLSGTLKMVRKN